MGTRTEGRVERAAAGADEALEQLVVAHLPELRVFVRRRLGPSVRAREAVSDVVQSTCRELLVHRGRFRHRERDGFRRWLFATALRKVLNKDRRHTAGRRDVRREGALVAEVPCHGTPSEWIVQTETTELLARSLERLPEAYRQVVLLSHVVDLSRAEVAATMGRSEASVRGLLNRALARLGAELGRSAN